MIKIRVVNLKVTLYSIFLFFAFSSQVFSKAADSFHILILHSYSPDSSWTSQLDHSIRKNIDDENYRIITYSEYMDTKRRSSQEYLKSLEDFYKQKYQKTKINLIITTDDNAFHFAMKNRSSIFRNAPVVFTGLNGVNDKRFDEYEKVGGYTGVVESFEIIKMVKTGLKIHPKAKKIYILNSIHENSGLYLKQEFKKAFEEFKPSQEIVYLEDYAIQDLYKKLGELDENSFILFGAFSRDKNGTFLNFEKSLESMSGYAGIPIYGFLKYYLPHGLTGGYFVSSEVYGEQAAILANHIIAGRNVDELPIVLKAPAPILFDYQKIVKYNIDISKLPENAQIINQKNKLQKFYQEYTIEFWIILFSFISLISSVFILSYYFNQQKNHKKAVLRINEELEKRVEDRTKQLIEQQSKLINSAKLASIGEMASGIAHEINNPLTIIDLSAHRLKQNADNETVEKSAQKIKDTVQRITKIIQGLKQLAKEDDSLSPELVNIREAIDDVISICQARFKDNEIDFKVNIANDLKVTGGAVQISQVILNLLNNAFDELVESEGKRWIKLEGKRDNDMVEISVTDSGDGIPQEIRERIMEPFFTTKVDKKGTGLGLSICKNIIEHHRGRLFVDTSSSNTRFVIQIPSIS
ncbi:GHKL domain-containing protein [Halobacteriovorax vibrionivorans]|uniref:histidine kinase n=2 Tax=Halobacteriovoraceae TaxID=1652132 RepID=A0ABY0IF15_9BACT|nr:GHKL domain-containing protein [Halobacteriovorax vibrionivorans]TGD49174.1 GHKL domain-containing protein [Halobacteriovorax sp. Y22]